METLNQLHFIRPHVLWVLPLVFAILWYLQKSATKSDGWSKICDPHLLKAIKLNSASGGSKLNLLLWPISLIAILAIAGPAFRKLPSPVIKNQSALILALDVSKSMLADDIKPNRLQRAKFKINDILEKREDGQTALIIYAGDAFVVTPLTDDTETIALMLKAISPTIMPSQGSRVDIALTKSQSLLQQAGYVNGDVLLISDGVNLDKAQQAARELKSNKITTSVLAVGTTDGAPIPTSQGFVKDSSGNIVIPKLEIDELKKLADAGNGKFVQISGDSSDIDYVLPKQVENNTETQNEGEDDGQFSSVQYIDEGPWLTLLLIPLFALLFRKGMLLSLFLVVGLHSPEPSYAITWDDIWLNADQRAAKMLKNNQSDLAYENAKSNEWKATSAFRNKDYEKASSLFNDGTADGFYNQGNALAAGGKFQEAIDAYNNSLQIRPDDEDTLYNKEQVEQALKQQEQQKKDQQEKEKEKEDQEKAQQDQENPDQGDQEQQDQDSQENQDQEEKGQENQDQGDNPEQQQEQSNPEEMTEEEKKKQEEEQKALEEEDKKAENEEKQQEQKLTPQEMAENAENKEAIEQWLRRIPDDPGGLLRRKFYYQYNQQNDKPDENEDW